MVENIFFAILIFVLGIISFVAWRRNRKILADGGYIRKFMAKGGGKCSWFSLKNEHKKKKKFH